MKTIVWDGQPITKPGLYSGIPLDDYHAQHVCAGPSFSSTNLRRVLEANGGSPAHMFAEWGGNPARIEAEETDAMILGRAVHHWLLGEARFSKTFAIQPDEMADPKTGELKAWHGSRNACKEWLNAAAELGLYVLSGKDVELMQGMARALERDPLVEQGILRGVIERSFIWRDKETGLWLKARPDVIPTESGDFADLKTARSIQYGDLMRTVSERAYHQQAALVSEGASICAGIETSSFTFVFVEKKPPFCVRNVHLKPDDLKLGARQNRVALRLIASCLASGRWPGPGEGHIVNLNLGDWYRKRAAADVEELERVLRDAGRAA